MADSDRSLGMMMPVTRRDLVHGASAVVGLAVAGSTVGASAQTLGAIYPPLKTGMRGFHPGAFEPIHALAWNGKEPAIEAVDTGEMYDLVIVGGGLSGLASAYFFRKQAGPSARILIIDNLEGIGGHAQRNEFEHEGKVLYAIAGSSYMVAPSDWSPEAKSILHDLNIGKGDPSDRMDSALYRSLGMSGAVFFNKEVHGRDVLVKGSIDTPTPEFLAKAPLSPKAREDLARLMNGKIDYMAGQTTDQKIAALEAMSYRDYLLKVAKVSPEILPFVQGVWALGTDTSSAWLAFFRYKPGFEGLGLQRPAKAAESPETKADDYTLPGGNSDVARLIIRSLIPDALPAGSPAQVADKRLDYSVLDRASNTTRIRSSSIVYRVKHLGAEPRLLDVDHREVQISYLRDGKTWSVKAGHVVLACMHNVIPFICPELPDIQKTALRKAVRLPNQITNVLFRNWRAFQEASLSRATAPTFFYGGMSLASQRYLGAMRPSQTPSDPIVVGFNTGGNSGILSNEYMVRGLCGENAPPVGALPDDQFRAVRAGLLKTPFDYFERQVRDMSTRILAGTSFDPARDILAVTVNRWSHGFAVGRISPFDEKIAQGEFPPTIYARQKFGRIAIANTDAVGSSNMQTAFDQAYRAINDLDGREYGQYELI